MSQEMEDSVISLINRVRDEAEDESDLDSSPNTHEDASKAAVVPEKAKRSIKVIVSLTGSLNGPRDFVYYGTDLDAHMPALATNSIRLCGNSDDLPPGKDVLTYPGNHQQIASVSGLHASIIEDRSPLLAAAFESSNSGQRLHLETLCSHTVMPFVRFLYTGSYSVSGEWEDVPTSVFLHCKMYHLGNLYDLFDLKSQAYVNLLRQCEFGCSSPEKPIDLCEAIGFAYKTLPGHNNISDALVQYCVSRCLSHKLHEDTEFKDLAFNVNAFHKDLTRVCRERSYEDESSAIIIQLPYKHYTSDTYASTEDRRIVGFTDMVHHFHSSDKFDDLESPKKKRQVTLEAEGASPMNIPGCFSQTVDASPCTTQVEARSTFNNLTLPIRQPTTSQTSRWPKTMREQSSYEGMTLPYRGLRDDLEKLSTAPPGLGFFGKHESVMGHEHEHPFDNSHVEDYDNGPKRVADEMERILQEFESEKARQYMPTWRNAPSQGVHDVTASSYMPSQASMEGSATSGSEVTCHASEVKRRKVESQAQKDYDPKSSWRRSRFTRLPSNRQPRAELPHARTSGGDNGAQAFFMSVADFEHLPAVPRFKLSNDTLDLTGTQPSDVTPRTIRSEDKCFIAGSNNPSPVPVARDAAGHKDHGQLLPPKTRSEQFRKAFAHSANDPLQDHTMHTWFLAQHILKSPVICKEVAERNNHTPVSGSSHFYEPTDAGLDEICKRFPHSKNNPVLDYQMQMKMLDYQNEKDRVMRQGWQKPQDQLRGPPSARCHQPTETHQTHIHGSESVVKQARPSVELENAPTAASQQRHKIPDREWLGLPGPEQYMVTLEKDAEKLRAQSKTRPMVAATSNHDAETAGSASGGQAHADPHQWRVQDHHMQLMLLEQQKQEQKRDMTFGWGDSTTMSDAERQEAADRDRAWSLLQTQPGQELELINQTACNYGQCSECDDSEEKSSAVPDGPSTAPGQTGYDSLLPNPKQCRANHQISDLPSSAQQNEPEVSTAATQSDIDMCESDSDSDLSWVDIPLADCKPTQPAAPGHTSNPSSGSGSTSARRPSTPSDAEWDFC